MPVREPYRTPDPNDFAKIVEYAEKLESLVKHPGWELYARQLEAWRQQYLAQVGLVVNPNELLRISGSVAAFAQALAWAEQTAAGLRRHLEQANKKEQRHG